MSIGGPGGLTPGKSEISKSLSELGPPKESDVLQFQGALEGQQQPGGGPQPSNVTEPSGPFDFQVNSGVLVTGKDSAANALIDYTKDIFAVHSNQSDAFTKKLGEIKEKGMDTADAIELQMMSAEMIIWTETISKSVGKVTQGLTAIIKGQ